MVLERTRLAVLGSPITHSKSPSIHAAAYAQLGLPWSYEAIEQSETTVAAFLDARDERWRGCSVTAPLKHEVRRWAASVDEASALTGASNTVLIATRQAWNTDVDGTVSAFRRAGVDDAETGLISGGGATALSSLVSLSRLGVSHVTVALRDPAKAGRLQTLAATLKLALHVVPLTQQLQGADLVMATLPASAPITPTFAVKPVALLDADYANGVSRYAGALGDRVIEGVEMLLEQALLQVRIFVHGDPAVPLASEDAVFAAMRAAL